MSPIEVMARAIEDLGSLDLANYQHRRIVATAALLALSQMEPTPGMVEAGVEAAEICGNILMRKHVTYTFRAMLAAAVKEKEDD